MPYEVIQGLKFFTQTTSAFSPKSYFLVDSNKAVPPTEEGVMDKQITSSSEHVGTETLVYYPRRSEGKEYGDKSINIGKIEYTNVRDLLAYFFLRIHYDYQKIGNWRDYCIGITSEIGVRQTEDGRSYITHMPMFDYDGKNIKTCIRKDVRLLQESFKLGPAHVFRTKRGFHVIFMCDEVEWEEYSDMLSVVKCCKGFKRAASNNFYATLRVSAKYTHFDIEPEYILEPKNREKLWRKKRKAYLVEELYRLGQECETHFASLFPEWACFQEDEKPWVSKSRRPHGKGKKLVKKKAEKLSEYGYGVFHPNQTLQTFTVKNNDQIVTWSIGLSNNTDVFPAGIFKQNK